ncbi:cytochrome c oxidase assembly factor 3, mitochondrial [Thrips palmi]|uniref:Cytochrome c oxidase assembly factor 3 n=1 Tax=Thrips palmi TaxID=161013 RepID=A0A6P8ZX62_THRPL|nr:cytochrome c oxidase assembly factor 3, mitochondrial [Thrips palmi]XP_034249402.1 cytochrome c oxidase assembly factor 3, mitochondrial [Thrips palmi]
MADESKPSKVDPLEGRSGVHSATRHYINLIEKQNQHRVAELLKHRKRTNLTGLGLFGVVVGIYAYTISAVKQEKFLDDFEEPKFIEKRV